MSKRSSFILNSRPSKDPLRPVSIPARVPARATIEGPLPDWGAGMPLPSEERAYFEVRLGRDFSGVRIHADEAAGRAAEAFDAKAFAVGEDIVFGPDQYRPGSQQGRHLLAHELAHVAQQQQRGSASPARSEAGARSVADHVQHDVPVPSGALQGAPQGVYCDPDEDKKKKGKHAEEDPGSALPPGPNLTLTTLPPIDWLKAQSTFGAHGQRLSLRDLGDIDKEWKRSSDLLDTLHIDDNFKLWFITKQWILNKGINLQLEDLQSRENPNAIDILNRDWKNQTGGWQTPIVPIFDIDWFRSKKKKKRN